MIARTYRAVSTKVLLILIKTPPIDLVPRGRNKVLQGKDRNESVKKQVLEERLKVCEEQDVVAQWTKRLIANLKSWYGKTHCDIDYYLAPILSEQGCFNAHLYRVKIKDELVPLMWRPGFR